MYAEDKNLIRQWNDDKKEPYKRNCIGCVGWVDPKQLKKKSLDKFVATICGEQWMERLLGVTWAEESGEQIIGNKRIILETINQIRHGKKHGRLPLRIRNTWIRTWLPCHRPASCFPCSSAFRSLWHEPADSDDDVELKKRCHYWQC